MPQINFYKLFTNVRVVIINFIINVYGYNIKSWFVYQIKKKVFWWFMVSEFYISSVHPVGAFYDNDSSKHGCGLPTSTRFTKVCLKKNQF
jgi:hypothetical protein